MMGASDPRPKSPITKANEGSTSCMDASGRLQKYLPSRPLIRSSIVRNGGGLKCNSSSSGANLVILSFGMSGFKFCAIAAACVDGQNPSRIIFSNSGGSASSIFLVYSNSTAWREPDLRHARNQSANASKPRPQFPDLQADSLFPMIGHGRDIW